MGKGVPRSAVFTFRTYGPESAAALARAWAAKMQFVFNLCRASRDPEHAPTQQELEAWPEQPEFSTCAQRSASVAAVMKRVQQIRRLFAT